MESKIETHEYEYFDTVDHCSVFQKLDGIRNGIVENLIFKQEIDKQFEALFFKALESVENNVKRIIFFELNMNNLSSYLTYFKSPNCKVNYIYCFVEDFETLFAIVDFVANGFSTLKRICLIDEMVANRIDGMVLLHSPDHYHTFGIKYRGLLNQDQIRRISGIVNGPNCHLETFAATFFEKDYSEKFWLQKQKRLLMMTIALALVGNSSSLKRFPMELQRMLSTFL
jgi:hypothetical protein